MTKLEILARIEQLETQIRHAEQKKSAGRDVKMATALIDAAKKEIASLSEQLKKMDAEEN